MPFRLIDELRQVKFLNRVLLLGLVLVAHLSYAQDSVESKASTSVSVPLEDEALHSRLVNVALQLDFYNEQCRGLTINRNFNRVNRLFINKYSLSANNYIEAFFHQEIRDYKKQMQRDFIQTLAKKRGCQGAKKQGWDKELKAQYNRFYRMAEESGWYPIIDRIAPTDL